MPKHTHMHKHKQIMVKNNHLSTRIQRGEGRLCFENGSHTLPQAALDSTLWSSLTSHLLPQVTAGPSYRRCIPKGTDRDTRHAQSAFLVPTGKDFNSLFWYHFMTDRPSKRFVLSPPIVASLVAEVLAGLAILGGLAYFAFFKKLDKYGAFPRFSSPLSLD